MGRKSVHFVTRLPITLQAVKSAAFVLTGQAPGPQVAGSARGGRAAGAGPGHREAAGPGNRAATVAFAQASEQGNANQPPESLRERKKRLTRAAIFDAARRLFAERGFDDVTVAEIADAANISVKTLFSYVRSKEELVFGDGPTVLDAVLAAVRDRRIGQTPLVAVARALLEAAGDDPGSQPGTPGSDNSDSGSSYSRGVRAWGYSAGRGGGKAAGREGGNSASLGAGGNFAGSGAGGYTAAGGYSAIGQMTRLDAFCRMAQAG